MSSSVAASVSFADNRRAYATLALGIICIGFSAILTKWANVPGPVSGFYRVAIATIVLALPFGLQMGRKRLPARSALLLAALGGLCFAGDLASWNTSLLVTSAANATLLGNTSTLWVGVVALLVFREKLGRFFWVGMTLAIVGAIAIVGQDALEHPHIGWGDLLAVVSSLFYAGYLLTTQFARRQLDTASYMWLSSAASSILLLILCLALGLPLYGFSAETYWSLVALGLISHVAGWLAINYSLGHLPASVTSVTLLSQPVVTALLAVPLLNEALGWVQIGGGALILLGIYLANNRKL